jgi:hypothetical protein
MVVQSMVIAGRLNEDIKLTDFIEKTLKRCEEIRERRFRCFDK